MLNQALQEQYEASLPGLVVEDRLAISSARSSEIQISPRALFANLLMAHTPSWEEMIADSIHVWLPPFDEWNKRVMHFYKGGYMMDTLEVSAKLGFVTFDEVLARIGGRSTPLPTYLDYG